MTVEDPTQQPRSIGRRVMFLLAVLSVIGVIVTLYNYFDASNGIHGSEGALLVIVSTILMLLASLALAFRWPPIRWIRGVLSALILLDIIGTAAAGYLLESWTLLILMIVALLVWLGSFLLPRSGRSTQPEIAR